MESQDLLGFKEYLSEVKGLSPKTQKDYLCYAKLIDVSKDLTQDYLLEFLQAHKNTSNVRGMILNLLQWIGKDFEIRMPPKQTGTKKKKIIRPIGAEEIKQLRSYFYERSFKEGLIFDMMYQGAMRRGEIINIRINSFGWMEWLLNDEGLCKLQITGKGNKQRNVWINSDTMMRILNHFRPQIINPDAFYNSDALLFAMKDNKTPINEAIVYTIIKRGSQRCLGRDIRPHELRHCRATELWKKGVNIHDIKNYLGHSNIGITEIYLHQSEQESLENIKKLM